MNLTIFCFRYFDIVHFLLCYICLVVVVPITEGIHQVAVDYHGSGYVRLRDTAYGILDTEGFAVRCIISSTTDIPFTIGWHWRDSHAHNPDYYFTWTTSKSKRESVFEYTSNLIWIPAITDSRKRTASGTIYASGSHADDTTETTICSDVTLTIIWPPTRPTLTNDNPAISGTTTILKCDTSDLGNPRSGVVWIKDGSNYTGPGPQNQSLYLPVTKTDDAASWQCYYYNMEGKSETSDISVLYINWKPEPPNILSTSGNSIIEIGDTIELKCTSADKGNPVGQIKWKQNGIVTSFTKETISFTATKNHNADKWCCSHYNTIGDGPCSNVINLTIYWPPGRSRLLVNAQFPKLHDSFTLACTGDQGNPKGRVAWYLDSLMFTNTTDITLNISSAAQEHNGDWSCMFYNHLDNGEISDSVRVQVLCLPSLYVEYVSYAFNESYVHFNLRLNDESATDTVNVQVCSTPHDEPLCSTASSKLENKELISDVELPEPSDHTLYNVTFIFSHGSRIVSRHGIALRGNEKQSNTSTIFAAVFGALWIITAGIAAVVILLYHRRLKEKDVNPPKEKEAEVHYVNVGAETGTDNVTYKTSATDYEDVARDAAPISAHNTENTTYMDLDQNDVQQTRNRPAELTVYQSLH